jgi:NAD(P)-dependent dehydrogenase (short-subunit alcohol dehydrogenase family)
MHYAVTKAGEMGMMRQLAAQLANDNIRVNAFLPGGTFDEATEKFVSHLGPGAAEALVNEMQLRHRKLMPEDLVGGMIFLASDESDMMTGQALPVDGGICFY